MAVIHDDIRSFLGAVAETPELWRSIDVRCVVVWMKDEWQNLNCRVRLDPRLPEEVPIEDNLPKLNRVAVLQEVFPVTELPRLLQQIRLRGRVRVSRASVRFLARDSKYNHFVEPYSSSYSRVGLSLTDHISGPWERGHALMLSGDTASHVFEEFRGTGGGLDAIFRRAGWNGLNEVMLRTLGDVLALSWSHPCRATFIAALEVDLDAARCSLRDGVLTFTVLSGSRLAAQRAELIVVGEASGSRVFRTVALSECSWEASVHGYEYTGHVELSGVNKCTVSLHVVGYDLGVFDVEEQAEEGRPPALLTAHRTIFPDAPDLRRIVLEARSNEGRNFERGIARLFSYCGFRVDHPGQIPYEQNGPDILVEITDRRLLLVVETTVAHLMNDTGKLNRVAKRAADVRLRLTQIDFDVIPLMVVPWERETLVLSELADAQSNNVTVVCKEDLDALLSMVETGADQRMIAQYLFPEPPQAPGYSWPVERNPLAD